MSKQRVTASHETADTLKEVEALSTDILEMLQELVEALEKDDTFNHNRVRESNRAVL
jgi:phosphate uptake regulator